MRSDEGNHCHHRARAVIRPRRNGRPDFTCMVFGPPTFLGFGEEFYHHLFLLIRRDAGFGSRVLPFSLDTFSGEGKCNLY